MKVNFKPFKVTQFANAAKTGPEATHGDVLLVSIPKLPDNFKNLEKVEDFCLALGEHSGHGHQFQELEAAVKAAPEKVDVRRFIAEDGTELKFFEVKEDVALRHQEHNSVIVPKGFYASGIVQEIDPFTKAMSAVRD